MRTKARATMLALAVGYVGIYLCRKNFSVAVPLLREAFGLSKGEVGRIASIGTIAYALGKLTLGPVVDRLGGQRTFLGALVGVALFGVLSGVTSTLPIFVLLYASNRFVAAGCWPSMMKLVPTWYAERKGAVVGWLSVSYALGGACAGLVAREVIARGGGWRAVMVVPALWLLVLAVGCTLVVRTGPLVATANTVAISGKAIFRSWSLLSNRTFVTVCGLSFSLTLLRESFNTWSVDFLHSLPGSAESLGKAALQSSYFDLAGAVAILFMGAVSDRVSQRVRAWLVSGALLLLVPVLLVLPTLGGGNAWMVALLMSGAGLLILAPYSLLAGIFAVECGGADAAGTASAIVDFVGYVAAILAGETLGRLLDSGGYSRAFGCLAALSAISALMAPLLGPKKAPAGPQN